MVWRAVQEAAPRTPSRVDRGGGDTNCLQRSRALLYITNWLNVEPNWHLWFSYSPISHLWTLAVEEQFYVIWAPVMILLLRLRRHAATLAAAAIALVALVEPVFLSGATFNRVYFGTDTRSAALFFGALCAFIGSTDGWRRLRIANWAPFLGAAIVAAICWSAYALRQEGHRGLWNTGLIVATLACDWRSSSWWKDPSGPPHAFSPRNCWSPSANAPTPCICGRTSSTPGYATPGRSSPILVIGCSFVAAEISYRLVEMPALRLKHHFTTTNPAASPRADRARRKGAVRVEPARALVVLRWGHAGRPAIDSETMGSLHGTGGCVLLLARPRSVAAVWGRDPGAGGRMRASGRSPTAWRGASRSP